MKPVRAVILVGENPASLTYVKNKKKACENSGIEYREIKLPDTITQDDLIKEVEKLNEDSEVNGFIGNHNLNDIK